MNPYGPPALSGANTNTAFWPRDGRMGVFLSPRLHLLLETTMVKKGGQSSSFPAKTVAPSLTSGKTKPQWKEVDVSSRC